MVNVKDFLKASEKDIENLLAKHKDELFGTCSETGLRPEDNSDHNCVTCRAFRTEKTEQALKDTKDSLGQALIIYESAKNDIAGLKSEKEGLLASIDYLKNNVNDLISAIQLLKADLLSNKRDNGRLNDEKAGLLGLLDQHAAEIANLTSQNATLKALEGRVASFIKGIA